MINNLELIDAISFAAKEHAGQYRADGLTPYINHPITVVQILIAAGVENTDVLVAAALHDVVEDCGVTYFQLENCFGTHVPFLVNQLTKNLNLNKFAARVEMVSRIARSSAEVQTIKLADMIANVRELIDSGWSDDKKSEYMDYIDALHAVILRAPVKLNRQFIASYVHAEKFFKRT